MGEAKNIYFTCLKYIEANNATVFSELLAGQKATNTSNHGSHPEFFRHVWKRIYCHPGGYSPRRNFLNLFKMHPRYVDLDDTRHEEPLPFVGVSGQVGSSRFSGSYGGVSPTYLSLSKMSYVFTYQPRLLYTVIMTDI